MEENHIFQGLRRDNHQIKQPKEFLWDAHNIRLTNRDDSTLLSITNERGPKSIGLSFKGKYVGHCTVGKYLIVFANEGNDYYIYRIEKIDDDFKRDIIFEYHKKWDKGWSPEHPIEAIGVYETELVQKVYWIDGKNQPRVINVVKDQLKGEFDYDTDSFDFVQTLNLEETVEVTELRGNGMFAPGVIQYAFTYYNKYSAESAIFYTTPLCYIAFKDRGGSPEERVSTSFNIEISNIDNRFQYLRIYSIHRTSIDSVPTVKRVTDISITGQDSVSYIDTGTIGDIVDPTSLLYIGGEPIIPTSMAAKDNTLFLGNYSIDRKSIPVEVVSKFENNNEEAGGESLYNNEGSIKLFFKSITCSTEAGEYYDYASQLHSQDISYFRANEHYRLGIQFQHESGKWSEPIVIKKDYTIPLKFIDSNGNQSLFRPSLTNSVLVLPSLSYTYQSDDIENIIEELSKLGYKKVRGVVCFPNGIDRKILAQGILCPTVFNYYQRYNSGVHSQSSWFLRPSYCGKNEEFSLTDREVHKDGTMAEFRHCHTLGRSNTEYAEIQSNDIPSESDLSIETINDIVEIGPNKIRDEFCVDQSIITLHSPDTEFNSSSFFNSDLTDTKLRIVGLIPFNRNIGDIDITTTSPTFFNEGSGFIHSKRGSVVNGGNSLLMGPYYYDALVVPKSAEDNKPVKDGLTNYAVYPWHRTGSLNSDYNRPEDTGTRSAVLEKKVISNLKFSNNPIWFNKPFYFKGGNSIPQLCMGEDGELLKIEGNSYMGNIETVLTRKDKYSIIINNDIDNDEYTTNDKVSKVADPISMKYKSTPHLVCKLTSESSDIETILPSIVGNTNSTIKTEVSSYKTKSKDANAQALTLYIFHQETVNSYSYDTSLIEGSPIGILGTTGFSKDNNEGVLGGYIYKAREVVGSWVKCSSESYPVGTVFKLKTSEGSQYFKVIYKGNSGFFHTVADITDEYTGNSEDDKTDGETPEIKVEEEEIDLEEYTDKETADTFSGSYLFLAELYRDNTTDKSFGGTSNSDIENNTLWIPAGEPVSLSTEFEVPFSFGDTYFQRYDCLKTYPYTLEDDNQIIEIGSFMCETLTNIDGRYDKNRGDYSNLKTTPQVFNLLNEIYSQKNNFFNYRILNEDYYKQNSFPSQVIWSLEKNLAEEIDSWTQITLATPLDLEGIYGAVIKLCNVNNTLLCLQEKAFSTIKFNVRVQIPTSDGVPIEISNGRKMEGVDIINNTIGCQNRWSVITTPKGIYFIDDNTDTLWAYTNEGLINMTDALSMKWWFKKNHSSVPWNPSSNPVNGIRTFYDPVYGDVYFTPGPEDKGNRDALCYSEQLGQFISQYSYGGVQAMFPFNGEFLTLKDNTNVELWKNFNGSYNSFFGENKGWDFSFISNESATLTKVFDTVELRTDKYWTYGSTARIVDSCPFSFIEASNEYQKGSTVINTSNMRKKFRVWRGQIPRNDGTRQRIRNPWAMITLGWTPSENIALPGENNYKVVIHDVSVKYTV